MSWTLTAVLIGVTAANADAVERPAVPTRDFSDWAERAYNQLSRVAAADLAASRLAVETALAEVRRHTSRLANGQIVERELALDELDRELARPVPDSDALRAVERSLRQLYPGGMQPAIDHLRTRVAQYAGRVRAATDSELVEQLDRDIQTIADFLAAPKSVRDRQLDTARDAYLRLARERLLDDVLAPVRKVLSHPNHRVVVRADYLRTVAGRQFTIPVQANDYWNGTSVRMAGNIASRTALDLSENARRAVLIVTYYGDGRLCLLARRPRAQIHADATQHMHARQTLYVDADGVAAAPLDLDITNHTVLRGVKLGRCARKGRPLMARLVERIVQSRLSAGDTQAAATVEKRITDRVADEGFDIAYRINGLFRRVYWDRFGARDIQPQLAVSTDVGGITWSAEYARYDQLGAPEEPPDVLPVSSPPLDLCAWLHESAVNNTVDVLAGSRWDEATFHMMFEDELKLERDDTEMLPLARFPAAVHFAGWQPLAVRFENSQVRLTARLQGFQYDGRSYELPETTVDARYDVTLGDRGLLLRRGALDVQPLPAGQLPLLEALQRFLPAQARSMPRFRNDSFGDRLGVRYLLLDGGWLVVGARRAGGTPARHANQEVTSR